MKKLKVVILGSGNIGTDLLIKVCRSAHLEIVGFSGRSLTSNGMLNAKALGVTTSDRGINFIVDNPDCCDLVFDATSASSHFTHSNILDKLGKIVIDLTPSKIGVMCIPSVNLAQCLNARNVNMITCGGQASIPIAYAISKVHKQIEYIEVVSSIASKSAGPATRSNLDEYIHTTEDGIKIFSGANKTKAILNLNPAEPCIIMKTTIFAKIVEPKLDELKESIKSIEERVKKYVPGYQIILGPLIENDRLTLTLSVKGRGDYLPEYAGNLDIINCAAIEMAEQYAYKAQNL